MASLFDEMMMRSDGLPSVSPSTTGASFPSSGSRRRSCTSLEEDENCRRMNFMTIEWQLWVETPTSCDGPCSLSAPLMLPSLQQSIRPLGDWSLPIAVNSHARFVFFEVPNHASFPGLQLHPLSDLQHQRPNPVGGIVSQASQSDSSFSRAVPPSLGILERTNAGGGGIRFRQLRKGTSTDRESALSSPSSQYSRPPRNPIARQVSSSSPKHLSTMSTTRPAVASKRRRSLYSSLRRVDISSLEDHSGGGRVIRQLVSSVSLSSSLSSSSSTLSVSSKDNDCPYVFSTLALTASGHVFGWFGAPDSPSSFVPLTWPFGSPPIIKRISAGSCHIVFLTREGDVWCRGKNPFLKEEDESCHREEGNVPNKLRGINEPVEDVACGADHLLLLLRSRRICQVRAGTLESVCIAHVSSDWEFCDCGAGESFNVVVLKNAITHKTRLLSWGWNPSDNRLGRDWTDTTAEVPSDVLVDVLRGRTLVITQLHVAGKGGCILCVDEEDQMGSDADESNGARGRGRMPCRSTSLWVWGDIPEYRTRNAMGKRHSGGGTDERTALPSGKQVARLRRWEPKGFAEKYTDVPEEEADSHFLQPIGGRPGKDILMLHPSILCGPNQRIEIVSACLSEDGFGILTIQWSAIPRGRRQTEEEKEGSTTSSVRSPTTDIPRLNLNALKTNTSLQNLATTGITSNVTEFWAKWGEGGKDHTRNPTISTSTESVFDVLNQLMEKTGGMLSNSSDSCSLRRQRKASATRSFVPNPRMPDAVSHLQAAPGIVLSTVETLPKTDAFLVTPQSSASVSFVSSSSASSELVSSQDPLSQIRLMNRETFRKAAPSQWQHSNEEKSRWWDALGAIGKSTAVTAMKEAWEDMRTDITRKVSRTSSGSGEGSSMRQFVGLGQKQEQQRNGLSRREGSRNTTASTDSISMISSRVFDVCDESQTQNESIVVASDDQFSIIPKLLVGPEWQRPSLGVVKNLLLKLERFRCIASSFWQSYLHKAEFNVSPREKSEVKSVSELKTLFTQIRRQCLDHFGISCQLDLFSLCESPNMAYWKLQHEGLESLKAPQGWSAILRIAHVLWMQCGCYYVAGQAMRSFTASSEFLTRLHLQSTPICLGSFSGPPSSLRMNKGDAVVQETRVRRIRLEAYEKVSGRRSDDVDDDVPIQDWEISPECITIVNAVPSGSLLPPTSKSKMYIGLYGCTLVGLKISVVHEASDDELKDRLHEIFVYPALRHPNILLFMGAIIRGPQIVLVTELARGSLWSLLHESDVDLSVSDLMHMASDVASALNFLHRHPARPSIHRDVKSSNIVLTGGDADGHSVVAKLCDFECLKLLPSDFQVHKQPAVTPQQHPLLSSLGIQESKPKRALSTLNVNPTTAFFAPRATGEDASVSERRLRSITSLPTKDFWLDGDRKTGLSPSYATASVGTLQWMAPEMMTTKMLLPGQQQGRLQLLNTFSDTLSREIHSLRLPPTVKVSRRPHPRVCVIADRPSLASTVRDSDSSTFSCSPLETQTSSSPIPLSLMNTTRVTHQVYTEKVDVYSYGVLLWEMFSRSPPYLGVDGKTVATLVRDRELCLPLDESIPPFPSAIMSVCMHPDPSKRPEMLTIRECLKEWELDRTRELSTQTQSMLFDVFAPFKKS